MKDIMITNTALIIAIYLHSEYFLCDCLEEHLGLHNICIYHEVDGYVGSLNWDGTHDIIDNHETILNNFIKEKKINYNGKLADTIK